jgi:galactan endo-1,6-beta-galactosidase
MDATVQSAVLPHLRSELDKRGLTGTRISASDETSYDLARTTWNSFSSSTKGLVNRVNVHGYQGSGGRRDLLYTDVVTTARKQLWNSEYGDSDGTGLTLASNLCLDFRWLHPTAWCYWQVMDPTAGWAMIHYDENTLQAGAVQTKYYVMGPVQPPHPPRHDDPRHGRRLRGGRPGHGGPTPGHRGRQHGRGPDGDLYTERADTYLSGKLLRVQFGAGAVQTFQVEGVAV